MDITSNDTDPLPSADVHVIGGGLGGLAAAALVARSGRSVVVHEQLGSLGGRAVSDDVNGFRFNRGRTRGTRAVRVPPCCSGWV